MNAPDWLTARPIAHRGLHDRSRGIIENSRSAFEAAVAQGYGIECDVQLSSDGVYVQVWDDDPVLPSRRASASSSRST